MPYDNYNIDTTASQYKTNTNTNTSNTYTSNVSTINTKTTNDDNTAVVANTAISDTTNANITGSAAGSNSSEKKDKKIKRILCLGDSITEGYYDSGSKFHPYSDKLLELLNSKKKDGEEYYIFNEGVSGECVYQQMSNRLPDLLNKHKPLDLVIILGGTNDLHKHDCDNINLFGSIKGMHVMCHRAGIKTVAITIPDSRYPKQKDEWKEVNKKIRDYAEENSDKVLLFDLARSLPYRTLDEGDQEKVWDDNLHFTPLGYDIMAQLIFDTIRGKF